MSKECFISNNKSHFFKRTAGNIFTQRHSDTKGVQHYGVLMIPFVQFE